MKNEDLLKIAKGMGLAARIYFDLSEDGDNMKLVAISDKFNVYRFDPENNKAQAFEVLEWLKDHGKFDLISSDYVIYSPDVGGDVHSDSSDLVMNILNVSRQVVNDE